MIPYKEDESASLTSQRISYAQATVGQRALALAGVHEELQHHFPTLPWNAWVKELDALQPNLWLEGHLVSLEWAYLVILTQRLANSSELPTLDPPIHGPRALYLARRLQEYAERAVMALAEIEANPAAYGMNTRAIIMKLAAGNGIAQEVLASLTGRIVSELRPGKSLSPELTPGSPLITARLQELAQIGFWPL